MMTQEQIIRAKVGLLELAKQLGNVSQAGHRATSRSRAARIPPDRRSRECPRHAGCRAAPRRDRGDTWEPHRQRLENLVLDGA
jgi:hypothetical protein